MGAEIVQEDKLQLIGPLYNRSALVRAGATVLSNQSNNVTIPKYSGSSAVWVGETGKSDGNEGTFSELSFTPKRLTAVIKMSRQFLIQDNVGAENLLRNDIINALLGKLESTLLGSGAGTATQPAGLGSVLTPTTIADWGDVIALETALESANVGGEYKYVLTPYVNGLTRTMPKDAGSGLFVQDVNKTIDGYEVLTTGNVFAKGGFVGNWSEYFLVQWGSLDLVVDPLTMVDQAMVRFVVNAYFDGKPRRNEAFQALNMA
jgi:HK97 family phage major capsid protein